MIKPRHPKPIGLMRLTVDRDTTLMAFLESRFPGSSKGRLRQRLKFHGVRLGGTPLTKAQTPLKAGDIIEVMRDKVPEAPLPHGLKVLWSDEHLMAVHKPAGLLSVASDTEKEVTAYYFLTAWHRSQIGDPRGRLFVVHRLDREASGLLLFARSEAVKEHLQTHWMQVEKIYSVLVSPPPNPPNGLWKSTLTPDEHMGVRAHFGAPREPEEREAQTAYRTVTIKGNVAYLEVKLITGRKHQIRVQARQAGCPVVGDDRYNQDGPDPLHRLGLHAWKLRLRHPVTGAPLIFESPLPGGFVAPARSRQSLAAQPARPHRPDGAPRNAAAKPPTHRGQRSQKDPGPNKPGRGGRSSKPSTRGSR